MPAHTLNGLRFTVIEFMVMAVVVVGFAIYVANAGASVFDSDFRASAPTA